MTDAEISQFKLIARGGEAEIYDMGDDKVLRVLWKQSDRSYHSSDTYGYLCPLLRQAHIDVPEIYEYTNVGERPAQIMQKIDGITMLKQLARQPFQIPSRIKRLAELHNRMFSVKTDDCLKSIDDRLRYFVSKSPIADKELIDFVLRVYESLPSGNNLCHGDFHPGNILMQNGECYIIDWSGVYRTFSVRCCPFVFIDESGSENSWTEQSVTFDDECCRKKNRQYLLKRHIETAKL
ncbi:MAG TPA: phosphotransferase [Ruminiclostridium sp.]|nr:phosphotransferase [Ruminiclostridium sp.]